MAQPHSRRRLFQGLVGSLSALGLGLPARSSAAFICRQEGALCAKDAQCCSGSCVNEHCACPTDQPPCGAACGPAAQVCTAQGCCTPATTCQSGQCGTISDGCGSTLDCGGCPSPQTCGGGGRPNVCGVPTDTCPSPPDYCLRGYPTQRCADGRWCATDIDGRVVCYTEGSGFPCSSDADCEVFVPGLICVQAAGCGGTACAYFS